MASRAGAFTSNAHDLTFPPDYVDPVSGFHIPHGNTPEHRQWRARVRAMVDEDGPHRHVIVDACAASFQFFTDAFVWTPKNMEVQEDGKQVGKAGEGVYQPYITWPVHLGLHKEFRRCIKEGEGLAIPKSRDMRATWHMLIEAAWDLLFNKDARILVLSRVEKLVDGPSQDALLPRVREIMKRLPRYMTRDIETRYMQVSNRRRGNYLDGESTTAEAGVGGRRLWMLYDEAARNRTLEASWDATRDLSSTRVVLSTFRGPNKFRDLVFSGLNVFPIGYWDHPDKGRGRVLRKDDSAGTVTGKAGSMFWWTPWLQQEVIRAMARGERSKIDAAQNVFMDPDVTGNVVFDVGSLLRQTARARVTHPTSVGDLVCTIPRGEARDDALRKLDVRPIVFRAGGRGRLHLWLPLVRDHKGRMRPPQDRAYCMFADPSQGLGAANTAIAIGDVDRGVKVGMLADPTLEPHELARTLIMLGIWFGGTTEHPLVGWETNGPGLNVQRHLEELEYPALEPWTSTRDAKLSGMEALREVYSNDKLKDYDLPTLREAGDYIILPGGRVEPQRLREDRDALATHGDRVVATMGLWLLMRDHADSDRRKRRPPKGSDEHDIQEILKRSRAERDFDGLSE
jgi:hypothetical protein